MSGRKEEEAKDKRQTTGRPKDEQLMDMGCTCIITWRNSTILRMIDGDGTLGPSFVFIYYRIPQSIRGLALTQALVFGGMPSGKCPLSAADGDLVG